jgi:penicillin-binding protein 2
VKGEPWYPGETISISIGQGFLTVTPIQMAKMASIVATNGRVVQPRLFKASRLRRTGNLKVEPESPFQQLSIPPNVFAHIKEGLAAVVTKGTAQRAKSDMVSIAGKTGTAQVVALKPDGDKDKNKELPKEFRDHAWFVAFAPVEHPRIAVAVLVEHMGHGGSASAPLAKALIEAYMKFQATPQENSL